MNIEKVVVERLHPKPDFYKNVLYCYAHLLLVNTIKFMKFTKY